jgi:hypothetical protein
MKENLPAQSPMPLTEAEALIWNKLADRPTWIDLLTMG